MADSNTKVRAANGQLYTFHSTQGLDGFLYVKGHRVYGAVAHAGADQPLAFTAQGKWAYLVTPNTAEVSRVEGEDIERTERASV